MSRSRVELVAVHALEDNLVEIDTWNDESSYRGARRGSGLLATTRSRGASPRDGAMCFARIPLLPRLVRSRDPNRVTPADERQEKSARDEKAETDEFTHDHVRVWCRRA